MYTVAMVQTPPPLSHYSLSRLRDFSANLCEIVSYSLLVIKNNNALYFLLVGFLKSEVDGT